jgi:hypothetical protein
MSVFTDEESTLLDKIAIEMALDRLSPLDRAFVVLRFAYDLPDDYAGPWPPYYADIGAYVGRHYLGKRLQDRQIRNRVNNAIALLRQMHCPSAPSSYTFTPSTTAYPLLRAA